MIIKCEKADLILFREVEDGPSDLDLSKSKNPFENTAYFQKKKHVIQKYGLI